MYILMHKDTEAACIEQDLDVPCLYRIKDVSDKLPKNCTDVVKWMQDRCYHLQIPLNCNQCTAVDLWIKRSHCVSLEDDSWVKDVYEATTWSDVKPFSGEMEAKVHLCFSWIANYGILVACLIMCLLLGSFMYLYNRWGGRL